MAEPVGRPRQTPRRKDSEPRTAKRVPTPSISTLNDLERNLDVNKQHPRLSNYQPSAMWLIVQFSAVLLLGLVLFVSPSNFSALVVVGDQRVGLLKKCVGTRCDDWLKIDGLDIGRQSNSSSSATDNQKRQETTSSTGAAAGSSGSLFSSIDFSSLYLVTGTAVLVAFYMSLYVFIFLAVRWPNRLKEPPLPPSSEDKMDQNQGEPVDDRSKWDRLKLFTYRAGRCLGLVNTILIFGCWCETLRIALSVKNNLNLSGTDGVGGGIILIMLAFLSTLYCTLRDLTIETGRLQHWIRLGCCCPNKILCWTRNLPSRNVTSRRPASGEVNSSIKDPAPAPASRQESLPR